MMAPAIITLIAFFLNIGFNAGLIALWGFKGAPLATSLSRLIQFLLLALAVYRHEIRRIKGLVGGGGGGESGGVEFHPSSGVDRELELEPLQRQNLVDSNSSTGSWAKALSRSNRDGRLLLPKKPSWLRVPTFRDMQGGLKSASSHIGLTDIIDASRGVGPHSLGGTAKYIWAQSRAAMQPSVMLHFLKLALPGGLMMAFEAGSFDFNTAMAGYLGSPVITAAHSAVFSLIYLTYTTFPFAIATASTIRYDKPLIHY